MTAIRFNSAFILAVLAFVAATNAAPLPVEHGEGSFFAARAPLKGGFGKNVGAQAVGGLAGSIPMMAMMGAPALGLRDVDEPLETRSPKGGRGGFAKDVGANAVGGLAGSIPMMAMMGAPALGLRDVEETGHIHTLMARAPRVPSFLKPKPKPKADPPTPGKPNPAGGPEKEPGMMSNIVGQGVGGLAGSLPFMMMPMGGGGGGGQQPAARDVQNSAQWEDEDGQHLDRRLAGAAVGLLRTGAGALGKMGGSAGMRGIGGDMVGGLAGSAPMMFNNKQ